MSSTATSPIIISSQDLRFNYSSPINNNISTNSNACEVQRSCVAPYVEIVEQPRSKMRFRYPSEKDQKHGFLTGQNPKAWPTVKLKNCMGKTPVFIRATLHTDENKQNIFNSLYGLNCDENGVCVIGPLDESMTAVFKQLNIISTPKKEQKLKFQKWCHQNSKKVPKDKKQIEEQLLKMTDTVRIYFEAVTSKSQVLASVYSDSIHHRSGGHLRILRLSKTCSQKKGNEEVFLICNKIKKDDIGIRFFEIDENGERIWEKEIKFNEVEVFHQVVIVFRTPPYDGNITSDIPKKVKMELFQPSDNETSEWREFEYIENYCDEEEVGKKRKKMQPNFSLTNYERNDSCASSNPSSSACSSAFNSPECSKDIPSQNSILSGFNDIIINNNYYPNKNESETDLFSAKQQKTDLPDSSPDFDLDNIFEESCFKFLLTNDNPMFSLPAWEAMQQQVVEDCFSNLMCTSETSHDYGTDSIASNGKTQDISWTADNKLNHTQNLQNKNKHKQSTTIYPQGEVEYLGQKFQKLNMYCAYFNRQNQHVKNFWLYCEKLSELDFEKYKTHINKDNGDSILHYAVRQKICFEFISHLLKAIHKYKNLALNCQNKFKETPLQLAIIVNSLSIVELFLKNNADPTIKDKNGKTALHWAAEHESATCLKLVLQYLKNVSCLNQADYNGQVPLNIAIYTSKSIECCKVLLNAGADVNQIDLKTGRNNLHLAVIHFPQVVDILLEYAVDIDAQDFFGNTALHLAFLNREYHIASILISAGANPLITNFNYEENQGQTVCDLAEDDIQLHHILKASTPFLRQKKINGEPDLKYNSKSTCNNKIECKIVNDATLKKLEDIFISSDLETLACFLGLDDNNLEGLIKLNENPVTAILRLFEKEGGTAELLLEALKMADLGKAEEIVQHYINEKINCID